ncbi:vacuolar protein sorting-associated protein 72 homolog [Trichonephila inaurata madagascariensis]|uniref:Vacuolar protein sorting-associated protein 72 homolog n=1 Tax=Trichonephila inaurata madagascariensis TaxID=2747483 RepID=A0A8X7CL83_9ARAC|nr:vacuolar protein sorting-associated protein 72 homolog [Trichonephila inaurata madagascariensis]
MLCTTRERRANAGNKMASLLENEDADDFYQSAYGGFADEADDPEYTEEDEFETDTDSDSDISGDEKDEPVSDQEEEETTKRKRKVVTKAYKEPTANKVKKEPKKHAPKTTTSTPIATTIEKKQMRESTTQKSLEAKKRTQAAENLKIQEQGRRKSRENHSMTQEQLLEEAKITELKNLKSLEMFQRLELEKKKKKLIKRNYTGPMIRYHSVAMPIIEVIEGENGKEENKTVGRCTRNFITYPDENTMKQYFTSEKPKPVTKSTCIVSGLPARYFDPLTKQPFINLTAFRIIREAYYTQLEKKVDPRQPHIAKWLEWRNEMRAAKLNSKGVKLHCVRIIN